MTIRKNLTQPAAWWAAFEKAAKRSGLSLSAWIGQQCRAGLTPTEREKLEERPPAHRPKKEED